MQSEPMVSILIAAYNHEQFITECLDSCLDQVNGFLEIVIIDDGSTDKTFEKICLWRDQHATDSLKVIAVHRPNKGLCATLNELVALSTGDFLVMLASDDMLVPESIKMRLLFFENHPDKLAVFADATAINIEGIEIANSCLTGMRVVSNKRALRSTRFLLHELLLRWNGSGPVLMLKRQAFDPQDGVGPYDETLFFEDRDMYLRLCAAGRLVFLDKIVANYRVNNTSMSRSKKNALKMRNGMMQSNRKALTYCCGSSRWILWLLIISGEGRWCWKPKLFWFPIGIVAELGKRVWLFLHDARVNWITVGEDEP